jgi:hydroxyacylglutathione hydrolase
MEDFIRLARDRQLNITHVVITHRHEDHHESARQIQDAFPNVAILCHPAERPHIAIANADATPDSVFEVGGLVIRILETPGHTAGSISPLINGHVFTGDTLFRGSVGGLISPGHTVFEDLKASIMRVLLTLPADTVILPGHDGRTTVDRELNSNPFVRVWRGLDKEGDQTCRAEGDAARLIVWARDYDDGHKAWIRRTDGSDLILAGSRIELEQ